MLGGVGDDTFYVADAGDTVTELAGEGTDEVRTILASYTLGSNVENLRFTGTGTFTGTGNSLDNTLTGGSGNDTLSGGTGNDTIKGGLGADTISGGQGDDTYLFARGDGQDSVANGDASSATTDRLRFVDISTDEDIWLGRSGDDLIVSILGEADRVSLTGWYSDAQNELDAIEVVGGQHLDRASVDQLVASMASFTGTDGLATSSVQPGSIPSSVQLAINSAWGS